MVDSTLTYTDATPLLAVTPNTTNQKVVVSKAGSTVGTRKQINLIEGTGVTMTVSDNAGSDSVDVTVNSTSGGGDALTTNPLSQFASTTSSQLAGVISDETGNGSLVFANTPTLITPVIGDATGESVVLSKANNQLAKFTNTTTSSATEGAGIIALADDGAGMASGDRLGFYVMGGAYDTSHTTTNTVSFEGFATENWSGTAK